MNLSFVSLNQPFLEAYKTFGTIIIHSPVFRLSHLSIMSKYSMSVIRDRGSTRSASARRRGGDNFESRADTAS